jgi:hypothetical protein
MGWRGSGSRGGRCWGRDDSVVAEGAAAGGLAAAGGTAADGGGILVRLRVRDWN